MVSQEELIEAIKEIKKYKKKGATDKECIKLLETAGYEEETINAVLNQLKTETSSEKNLKEDSMLRKALEKEEKINARTPIIKESIFSNLPKKKERVEEFEKSQLQELPINDLILDEEKIDEHLNEPRTKTLIKEKTETPSIEKQEVELLEEKKEKKFGFGEFFKGLGEKFKSKPKEKNDETENALNELKKIKDGLEKEEKNNKPISFEKESLIEEKELELEELEPEEKKTGLEEKFEKLKKKLKVK